MYCRIYRYAKSSITLQCTAVYVELAENGLLELRQIAVDKRSNQLYGSQPMLLAKKNLL